MVTLEILGIAYLLTFPLVFLVVSRVKEVMHWERVGIMEFASIWLIMPFFIVGYMIFNISRRFK